MASYNTCDIAGLHLLYDIFYAKPAAEHIYWNLLDNNVVVNRMMDEVFPSLYDLIDLHPQVLTRWAAF